jgi:hypothetical protein
MFGIGTAVAVCPIKGMFYENKMYDIPINPKIGAGNLSKKLYK